MQFSAYTLHLFRKFEAQRKAVQYEMPYTCSRKEDEARIGYEMEEG
jgi:hypothetical protein